MPPPSTTSPASSSSTPPTPLRLDEAFKAAQEGRKALNEKKETGIGGRAMVVTPNRSAVLSGTKVTKPQQDVMRGRGLTLSASKPWINESRAQTIGAVFPEQSDGGVPGQFHADPTALTTADAIGDSYRMCTSCQEFTLRESIASGRTKTVRDPNFERVFTPSGPHQGGFGRAEVTKTAKGESQLARPKPAVRREQALAFPSGVTVAEQSHRPGQTKVRFPSSARHLLPADVATADRPLLSRRAPRPSLGTKGGTTQVEGTVATSDTERRIRFDTADGVVEVTVRDGQVQTFHLTPKSASGAQGTMTLNRGERPELVSGSARYQPVFGGARDLPALPADNSAPSSAPAPLTTTTTTTSTPLPAFSPPSFSTTPSSTAPPVLPAPSPASHSSLPSPSPSSHPPSTLPVPSPSSSQPAGPAFDFSLSDAELLDAIEKGLI